MKTTVSILIIDDEPILLNTIKFTLEIAGYQVLTANNGLEALAVLQAQPVDLVMSDVDMPHLNGYQLFQQVRENRQWATIPFVFLTGRSSDQALRYGMALGVDDYLIKPIRLKTLLSVIQSRLGRTRQLAQTEQAPEEQLKNEAILYADWYFSQKNLYMEAR